MKKKLFIICYIICLVCVGCGDNQPQSEDIAAYKPLFEEIPAEELDASDVENAEEALETGDEADSSDTGEAVGASETGKASDESETGEAASESEIGKVSGELETGKVSDESETGNASDESETENASDAGDATDNSHTYGRMAGIWVATVRNVDYPVEATLDSAQLKREADAIIDNCAKMGINSIFLQVRPTCDAFYKSSIFPWSKYLTGAQGTAPTDGFDPLQYWTTQAHAKGIQLHAWINPYRVTRDNDEGDTEYSTMLCSENPAVRHPEYLIKYDNNYYFDPAIPEVRQLVLDGVREIVSGYDVDGIHFDDYFYPGLDFADDASYGKYGEGFSDKLEWRRDNVNKLVAAVKPMVQSIKPNVVFGISPSGIWANEKSNALGSKTNGRESYMQLAADTRKWAIEGWVDYIAPQLYWSIGYEKADYQVLAKWWAKQLADCDTKLYIGIPDYRVIESKSGTEWYGENGVRQISKQLELNDSIPKITGEIHYNYSSVAKTAALQEIYRGRYRQYSEGSEYREIREDMTAVDFPKRILTDELCTGVAKEIFEQTNAERAARGIDPLAWDDELAKPAGIRAREIITRFSHVRADGTKCYALSNLIYGENIARGPHATGKDFMEHWMASKGHKANILEKRYKSIGVGVRCTERGDTAVQLFGLYSE